MADIQLIVLANNNAGIVGGESLIYYQAALGEMPEEILFDTISRLQQEECMYNDM